MLDKTSSVLYTSIIRVKQLNNKHMKTKIFIKNNRKIKEETYYHEDSIVNQIEKLDEEIYSLDDNSEKREQLRNEQVELIKEKNKALMKFIETKIGKIKEEERRRGGVVIVRGTKGTTMTLDRKYKTGVKNIEELIAKDRMAANFANELEFQLEETVATINPINKKVVYATITANKI